MTKRFRVAARLLCADIKLSTEVSVIVTQEDRPTEAQARELIWAEADEILAPEGTGGDYAEGSDEVKHIWTGAKLLTCKG